MAHRKANFSVFLVSRSILLCSFKCLSLVSFFGIVYISASFVVSIFLSPENIIVSFFSDIKEKCSSNVVERRSSAQITDFTTIGVRKKKKQTEKLVSICLKYVILECFTLTVLLRQYAARRSYRFYRGRRLFLQLAEFCHSHARTIRDCHKRFSEEGEQYRPFGKIPLFLPGRDLHSPFE